jgi:predicted DNA-binding protein with PD1-like motif
MKYSEATAGRVFILRLEDGDILHETVETFAREKGIEAGSLIAVGGADTSSTLVVGPKEDRGSPVVPLTYDISGAHEITGTGTLFPDANGNPVLHMHIAGGREGGAVVGCVRSGVKTWHVIEIILYELTGTRARRLIEENTGFELLDPAPPG